MSSTIPTSENKRKSSKNSSKIKRADKPAKSTKKSSSKKLKETLPEIDSDNDTIEENETKIQEITDHATKYGQSRIQELTDSEDEESNIQEITDDDFNDDSDANSGDDSDDDSDDSEEENRNIQDIADDATEQLHNAIEQIVSDDDDKDKIGDDDALTTMNAILEYNRMLVQNLEALEAKTGGLKKGDIQNTVHDTMNEVSAKYNKKEESSGTHHSFELPVGDMLKGYGSFSTSEAYDKDDKKKNEDEESTVKDDDDGKIRIGDGEKDDIVVKVEATKSGITFSIHIPRN